MTTERDARTRIVLSWLHEDAHEDAERVLLLALDEVETTPQRGRASPVRRFADMNSYAKLAIAAAATVVVAIAGIQLLPGATSPGGQPTASPSPTASPTSTPEPSLSPLTTRSLSPGRYALDWSGPPTSLEVPAGWTGLALGQGTEAVRKDDDAVEVGWGGWPRPITHVYTDACQTRSDLEPVDGTLQGLVDALDAQVSTDATITDVTLGGNPAKRVDLTPSPGIEEVVCQTGDAGLLEIWAAPTEAGLWALIPGARGIVHVLEIDGELVVFTGITGPGTSASDLAELEAVIASTRIGP
jgi:hypothetical protein